MGLEVLKLSETLDCAGFLQRFLKLGLKFLTNRLLQKADRSRSGILSLPSLDVVYCRDAETRFFGELGRSHILFLPHSR